MCALEVQYMTAHTYSGHQGAQGVEEGGGDFRSYDAVLFLKDE